MGSVPSTRYNTRAVDATTKMPSDYGAKLVDTKPYDGQKPGTSGLRKKVRVIVKPQPYLGCKIQMTLISMFSDHRQQAQQCRSRSVLHHQHRSRRTPRDTIGAGEGV